MPSSLTENLIFQILSSHGDGTGTTEMVADAAVYKVTPPTGEKYVLSRINIYIEDNGKFRGDYYGGSAALSPGIVLTVENASRVLKTLTPHPITTVGEWALQAGIDMLYQNYDAGNSTCFVRWTFTHGGGPVILRGNEGEFLKFNVQDDLDASGADLVSHLAQVQGKRIFYS